MPGVVLENKPISRVVVGNAVITFDRSDRDAKTGTVNLQLLDHAGAPLTACRLENVTQRQFKKFVRKYRDRTASVQSSAPQTLVGEEIASPVSENIAPEVLRHLLSGLIKTAKDFSGSNNTHYTSSVGNFVDNYVDLANSLIKSGATKITRIDYDAQQKWQVNNSGETVMPEGSSAVFSWIDIDTHLAQGEIKVRDFKQLLRKHLDPDFFKEYSDYQCFPGHYLQLRGVNIDPLDQDQVTRAKICILITDRHIITVHDGPIDRVRSNAVLGETDFNEGGDSIGLLRSALLSNDNAIQSDSLVSLESEQGKTPGTGTVLIDLANSVLSAQRDVVRRLDRNLIDATNDLDLEPNPALRVKVSPWNISRSLKYIHNRLNTAADRVSEFFDYVGLEENQQRWLFGDHTADEIALHQKKLANNISELASQTDKSVTSIQTYKDRLESLREAERNGRGYWISAGVSLFAPFFIASEIAGLSALASYQNIIMEVGAGVGVMAVAGFVALDYVRQKRFGLK